MEIELKMPIEKIKDYKEFNSGKNIAIFRNEKGDGNLIVRDYKGCRIFQFLWFNKDKSLVVKECPLKIIEMTEKELREYITDVITNI